MIVRDLVPAFLDFWASVTGLPREQQLARWTDYERAYPEVVNDAVRQGRVADVGRALDRYPAKLDLVRTNAPQVAQWLTAAADLVVPALGAQEVVLEAVSMVGIATSNGWIDGQTLYLAVEMVSDVDGAQILAAHELAHACHFPLSTQTWPDEGPLGLDVFAEGFATALTCELMPQHGLAEHLWFEPGHDGWLADAETVLTQARAEIRGARNSVDRHVGRRYLAGGDDLDSPYPSRIGYLVGTRLVQELRNDHSWHDMARWTPDQAMTVLDRAF